MSAHTAGPWIVAPHGPNGCQVIGTEHGLMVAMTAHSVIYEDQRDEALANASLMAAAPELLAALQAIIEHTEGCVPDTPKSIWRDARAAIAKATGEQP